MASENMNSDFRVASFSCYLDSAEESFVQKLNKISDTPSTIISSKTTPCLNNLRRSTDTTLEISLFGADKYSTCNEGFKYAHETDMCLRQYVLEQDFWPKTPSICSALSSWDGQSMSLSDPHRNLKKQPQVQHSVFGSTMTKKEDIIVNLERKLSTLTWDAIPKTPNIRPPNITQSDDMNSDGSSNFFKIDNISTDKNTVLSKQVPYPLSKAKDLCTIISRSRGLFGCKSYKAVRVAENYSSDKAKGCHMYSSTKNGPSKLQPAGRYHHTS